MTFDIVILSYAKTKEHKQITEKCIKSLMEAKNKVKVNIIVLESYDPTIKYKDAKNVFYQQPVFNYNNSMNEGFKYAKNDYVFFCNNDLVFYDGWADACYQVFAMGYESLSPYCPTSHKHNKDINGNLAGTGNYLIEGYQVGFHVAGWCIGVDRYMFERIGGFNEAVRFWYSDNIYAEQLKLEGIKHALVCNAIVKHLDYGSMTLKTLSKGEKTQLTSVQRKKYDNEVRRLWNVKTKEILHGRPKDASV